MICKSCPRKNSLIEGKEGFYLSLNPLISPYDCAVLPLVKKKEIYNLSKKVESLLKDSWFDVYFDESGSIGRRYARNDEIGTPFCITIDGDSIKNEDVTIRNRDGGRQIRVKISKLKEVLRNLINQEVDFEKCGQLVK